MTLPILQAFARNRRILLIRRIVAVSFGLVGFALPGLTQTDALVSPAYSSPS